MKIYTMLTLLSLKLKASRSKFLSKSWLRRAINCAEINAQTYISEQSTLRIIARAINQTPCLQLVP